MHADKTYEAALALATSKNGARHRPKVLKLLRSAARDGDSRARYALATWHLFGVGVRKNARSAVRLLKQAARQGQQPQA